MACLKRISEDLRATASRNTAVALYRSGSAEQHQRPLFVIGSRSRFDGSGRCPVATRSRSSTQKKMPAEDALRSIIEIAALFHDVGKASRLFNAKIRRAIATGEALADPVRHEVISAMILAELLPMDCVDVPAISERLLQIAAEPSLVDEAWAKTAPGVEKLKNQGAAKADLISTAKGLGDPASLRAQLILLVLSHHRLPDAEHATANDRAPRNAVRCGVHFRFDLDMTAADLEIADGVPFWHESWFSSRLASAAQRLSEAEMIPLEGLDVLARTALMSADHTGSSDKDPGKDEGHIANSVRLPDGTSVPGDSLSRHTCRVVRNGRSMMLGHLRHGASCPSIAEDMVSPAIRAPRIQGTRYDWQAHAAHAAADVVSSGDGGFFGVLTAGTGSGKTRGAATVMAGATLNDAGFRGTGLRFNLALPLRTLATQSGREYVEDLGFSTQDVSVMVGGSLPEWNDEVIPAEAEAREASGSEDRSDLPGELVSMATEEMDAEAIVHAGALGIDLERRLPAHLDLFCEADRSGAARSFLATPILCATIDHFMPAASPLRGGHVAAAWRVLTADLVIDEIDQMSEEDLSAVRRLVRIAGLGGRRVLIMSATLNASLVSSFHEVYSDAWRTHAEMTGRSRVVHHMVAGDAPGAVRSSLRDDNILDSMEACAGSMATDLDDKESVQIAEILPRAKTWCDQVEIIRDHARVLHDRHHSVVDGRRVSAGLVRITRVRHLQRLAVDLAREDDGCLYLVLHSAMPRVVRDRIERDLKAILTRKGKDPDRALVDFVRTHAPSAWKEGSDVRVIVLSSPVIETGNDVDFDWAIIDAPSVRSIVQTAGRVNRHRRLAVAEANVAILGDYLVAREAIPQGRGGDERQSAGMMMRPGVETPLPRECGVEQIKLSDDKSMNALLGRSGPFVVDARLCDPGTSTLAAAEDALQRRFAYIFDQDRENPLFWMSRRVARHKFRRQDGLTIDAFPVCDDVGTWKAFIGCRRETSPTGVFVLDATCFRGHLLRPLDLNGLLREVRGARPGALATMSPLQLRIGNDDNISMTQYLDAVLGNLGKDACPAIVTFLDLSDPSIPGIEKNARKTER